MASTYTDAGIELIAVGEQSNTWGLTTNTNWRLMEEMATGVAQISLTGLTSYSLTTTDGVTSNGRHMIIEFTGAPGATSTVTVVPNDMQKLYFINNATDQSVTITQGSGGDVTVPAGTKKIVYCDGAGSGAKVTDVTENLSLSGEVDVTTLKINGVEVTADAAEINTLDGLSASTAELNVLDGITATTAELNKVDGLTASTAELNLLDGVTASTAEINKLDGLTATTAELNTLDGVTASTAELNIMDGVTASTAEINHVGGVTSGIQGQLDDKADKVASATTDNFAALDSNGNLKDSGENPASVGSPSGTVANFAGQSAPTGWLLCDGSNVNRATYPSLFDVIGETFGAGDGSTTFGLPDLRGEFVRGWDNGRGVDSGRSFGSFQADEFRAHSHSYTRPESVSVLDIGNQNASLTSDPANTSIEGGDETRPRNIALNYIIKT